MNIFLCDSTYCQIAFPKGCAHFKLLQHSFKNDWLPRPRWAPNLSDCRLNSSACTPGKGSRREGSDQALLWGSRCPLHYLPPCDRGGGRSISRAPAQARGIHVTHLTPVWTKVCVTRKPRPTPLTGLSLPGLTPSCMEANRKSLFFIFELGQPSRLSKSNLFFQNQSLYRSMIASQRIRMPFSFSVILLNLHIYLEKSRKTLNKSLGPNPSVFWRQRHVVGRTQTLESGY